MGVAVLVHTCDKYAFCWDGWEYYFNLFWDFNFPAKIYFANEQIDREFHLPTPVTQIKTGSGEFSDRLIYALNAIEEEHIFYLQEDAWLQQTIDLPMLYRVFCVLGMNCFRISQELVMDTELVPDPRDSTRIIPLEGVFLRKAKPPTNHLLSHMPSFWKRDFFLSCMVPGENPWDNETNGTFRLMGAKLVQFAVPPALKVCTIDPDKLKQDLGIYILWKPWFYCVCDRGELNSWGKMLTERMNSGRRCYNCPYVRQI